MKVSLCSETGICSLIQGNNKKVDLMPFEVDELRAAKGSLSKMKEVVAQINEEFAAELSDADAAQIMTSLS